MKIVADAGSTKTSWALIHSGRVQYIQTAGIHALLHSDDRIKNVLDHVIAILNNKKLYAEVKTVYFFGTGCQSTQAYERLAGLFTTYFPEAKLSFRSDMEAACIAASANEPAWVFILGTGSNSCVWNGTTILAQVPSGGYILGDEGSGAYLGKELLKLWIRKKLPAEIQDLLNSSYQLAYNELVNNLYRSDTPNTYLASFVPFIHQHRSNPFIRELILASFANLKKAHEDFLHTIESTIPANVGFVGSVAHYFRNELKAVFAPCYTFTAIIHRPVEALASYYQHNHLTT